MPTRYEYTSISCARSSTISTPHYLKDGFFKSNGENIFFFLMNELKLYVRYVYLFNCFQKGIWIDFTKQKLSWTIDKLRMFD